MHRNKTIAIAGGFFILFVLVSVGTWMVVTSTSSSHSVQASAMQTPQRQPLPFDPLSPEELKRAEATALKDPKVDSVLRGSRFRVLVVERHEEDKTTVERTPATRRADVTIYQYQFVGTVNTDSDRTINVLVDLRTNSVVDLAVRTRVTPPIHVDEIAEALAIALKDERIRQILRRLEIPEQAVRASALLFVGDEGPCAQNRCLHLFLDAPPRAIPAVPLVNLTRQRVERIDPR